MMELEELKKEYDELQIKYGAKELDSIYNGGCEDIYHRIKTLKSVEWDDKFAQEVYEDVSKHKYFITNLGKCTQVDARPLPNSVYKEYLHLLKEEIAIVNPKVIVLFGNQVSSIPYFTRLVTVDLILINR